MIKLTVDIIDEAFGNAFCKEYERRKSEKDNTIDVELLEEETIEVIRDDK